MGYLRNLFIVNELTRDGQKVDGIDDDEQTDDTEPNNYDINGDTETNNDDATGNTEDNNEDDNNTDDNSDDDPNAEPESNDYDINGDAESGGDDNNDDSSGDEGNSDDNDGFEGTDDSDDSSETDDSSNSDNSSETDDSSSDDDGLEEDKTPDQKVKEMEKELSNLSPEQENIRNDLLKKQYIQLYNNCSDITKKMNSITKSSKNEDNLGFAISTLSELKKYIYSYLTNTFATKSYGQNYANFNTYLVTLNSVTKLLNLVKDKPKK